MSIVYLYPCPFQNTKQNPFWNILKQTCIKSPLETQVIVASYELKQWFLQELKESLPLIQTLPQIHTCDELIIQHANIPIQETQRIETLILKNSLLQIKNNK